MAQRTVLLQGSLGIYDWVELTSGWSAIFNQIQQALVNQGFDVVAVRHTLGWNGLTTTIEIELKVDCIYTSEDARVSAMNTINQITARINYGIAYGAYSPAITNLTLSVVYDQGCDSNGSALPQSNIPSNYDTNGTKKDGEAWSEFWKGLGLSTPPTIGVIALIGAGYILLTSRK